MRNLILAVLVIAVAALGCVTTELPDGTKIREWDIPAIWELARIGMEVQALEADLEERRHEMSEEALERRHQRMLHLVEQIDELRKEAGI